MHEAAKFVKEEELLRLLLSGCMLKECAAQMKLSYHTVRKYAKQPEFLLKLKRMSQVIYERLDGELMNSKEAIIDRLEAASDVALTAMETIVRESKSEQNRIKAAQDIMDRDGRISRTRRIENTGNNNFGFMNPLVLQHMAVTAQEVDAYEEKKAKGELPSASGS